MTGRGFQLPLQRRSFLSRLAAGITTFAAASGAAAQAQSAVNERWQPTRHAQDDWLDAMPGKHRLVFDTITPDSFGLALLFCNNYFIANQNGYGLQNPDLAVVIVARHLSTPFAFNDAMWAKYGTTMAQLANFTDPKTKQAPTSNLYNAAGYGPALANRGATLDTLIKRGVRFAVCEMATRQLAEPLSAAAGTNADAVYKDLLTNLMSNSQSVPAGIVAVNRAQERGYSVVSA
jgi:intracellular sulfur oxidation DsrE/DsrF family protein